MAATANQLHPDNATYLDTYAWVFFKRENYSLAKFYMERAISLEEEPGRVMLEHYGDILYKVGQIEKAVEQWQKALEMDDDEQETTNDKILIKKITDKKYYENE